MNSEPGADEQLMKRAATGHRFSFEKLIRAHASSLLTFITRTLGNHHQGEEVFQEVVLLLWKKRQQYQYPKPFRPWLLTIAMNRCRQHFRDAKTAVTNQEEKLSSLKGGDSSEVSTMAVERSALIKQAVQRLPEQQRSVVVLRVWNELSYREIAKIVGAGEATVRSYMHQALKALRTSLETHRP